MVTTLAVFFLTGCKSYNSAYQTVVIEGVVEEMGFTPVVQEFFPYSIGTIFTTKLDNWKINDLDPLCSGFSFLTKKPISKDISSIQRDRLWKFIEKKYANPPIYLNLPNHKDLTSSLSVNTISTSFLTREVINESLSLSSKDCSLVINNRSSRAETILIASKSLETELLYKIEFFNPKDANFFNAHLENTIYSDNSKVLRYERNDFYFEVYVNELLGVSLDSLEF